jgi:hypothetical protein
MSIENRVIQLIQRNLYTEEHSYLDYFGKVISSRKYRKIYLSIIIAHFIILFLKDLIKIDDLLYKFYSISKIYILGRVSREINIYIKLYFKRRRPFIKYSDILTDNKTRFKKKDTFSFPSNSIQTSLIFYNFLLSETFEVGFNKNIILFLITIVISLSKINRGLHYPSDIIFSILIFILTKTVFYVFVNFVFILLLQVQ